MKRGFKIIIIGVGFEAFLFVYLLIERIFAYSCAFCYSTPITPLLELRREFVTDLPLVLLFGGIILILSGAAIFVLDRRTNTNCEPKDYKQKSES